MELFRDMSPDVGRLKAYGFVEEGGALRFRTEILDGAFLLDVEIAGGAVKTSLTDALSEEPYTLHLVEAAEGEFVGSVRAAYRAALGEIAKNCFVKDVFRFAQTKELIELVREKYGDEPEYLWEKFPDNAVFRRKDNQKWYAAVLTTEREKLGAAGEGRAEILDVRMAPEELDLLVDGKRFFRGWHMNKKHWATVLLDGTFSAEELLGLVEESRFLAK